MIPAPDWPGFRPAFALPGRRAVPLRPAGDEVPDQHSQLEELLGHVRRCERWARIDDRIDLSRRLEGKG